MNSSSSANKDLIAQLTDRSTSSSSDIKLTLPSSTSNEMLHIPVRLSDTLKAVSSSSLLAAEQGQHHDRTSSHEMTTRTSKSTSDKSRRKKRESSRASSSRSKLHEEILPSQLSSERIDADNNYDVGFAAMNQPSSNQPNIGMSSSHSGSSSRRRYRTQPLDEPILRHRDVRPASVTRDAYESRGRTMFASHRDPYDSSDSAPPSSHFVPSHSELKTTTTTATTTTTGINNNNNNTTGSSSTHLKRRGLASYFTAEDLASFSEGTRRILLAEMNTRHYPSSSSSSAIQSSAGITTANTTASTHRRDDSNHLSSTTASNLNPITRGRTYSREVHKYSDLEQPSITNRSIGSTKSYQDPSQTYQDRYDTLFGNQPRSYSVPRSSPNKSRGFEKSHHPPHYYTQDHQHDLSLNERYHYAGRGETTTREGHHHEQHHQQEGQQGEQQEEEHVEDISFGSIPFKETGKGLAWEIPSEIGNGPLIGDEVLESVSERKRREVNHSLNMNNMSTGIGGRGFGTWRTSK